MNEVVLISESKDKKMIRRLRLTFSKSEVSQQCSPGQEHEK